MTVYLILGLLLLVVALAIYNIATFKNEMDHPKSKGDEPPTITFEEGGESQIFDGTIAAKWTPMGEIPEAETTQIKQTVYKNWILIPNKGELCKGINAPHAIEGKLFNEYDFNVDIIKKIAKGLENLGISHSTIIPDKSRANALKSKVKEINSIKADSMNTLIIVGASAYGKDGEWRNPNGFEVWHQKDNKESKNIAAEFRNSLTNLTDLKNRGELRTRTGDREFYLFRNVNMPAIQTMNGFYTNEEECRDLMDPVVRNIIANAHIAAIYNYENNATNEN